MAGESITPLGQTVHPWQAVTVRTVGPQTPNPTPAGARNCLRGAREAAGTSGISSPWRLVRWRCPEPKRSAASADSPRLSGREATGHQVQTDGEVPVLPLAHHSAGFQFAVIQRRS